MKIIVNPHKCEIEKTPINEKEINITKCEFQFADEITQDYVKEAYFTLNGSTYMQIIQNDECDIPYEVLENKGTLEIGVVAYLLENTRTLLDPQIIKRYNPSPVYINTWQGSLKDQYENSEEVTPTDKEQIMQALTDVENAINNLDIDATKVDDTTTITITKKDGTTKEVEILDGEDGEDGNGIESIEKTGTSGLVDTYTITFTDGKTTTFEITNGEDGEVTQAQLDETNRQVEQANLVYNALPKVTGSGEEITLNNTAETPLKLTLKGNTYQETTTGKNLCNPQGHLSVASPTYITASSNISSPYTTQIDYRGVSFIAKVEANKTYAISSDISLTSNYQVGIYDSIDKVGVGTNIIEKISDVTSTFTPTHSGYAVIGKIARASGTTITWSWIQVELGSTATDYEPYTNGVAPNPDFPMPVQVVTGDNTIKVRGKQLFDFNNATYLNYGTVTVTGVADNFTISSTNQYGLRAYCIGKINYNTLYRYMSSTYANASIGLFVANNNTYENWTTYTNDRTQLTTNWNTTTYDLSSYQGKYLWVHLRGRNDTQYSSVTYENFILSSQEVNAYTPYQSQEYEINLGTLELCKIGDYQDYLYKSGENWYKHTEIGKHTFIGNEAENWSKYTNTDSQGNTYGFNISLPNTPLQVTNVSNFALSNYFKQNNRNAVSIIDTKGIYLGSGDTFFLKIDQSLVSGGTTTNLKTWLSTHNTIVYYVLATPTEEQITNAELIEQLNDLYYARAYQEQTNVNQENVNRSFIMNAETVRNLSNE